MENNQKLKGIWLKLGEKIASQMPFFLKEKKIEDEKYIASILKQNIYWEYLQIFFKTTQEALYSKHSIEKLNRKEASNISEFFVSYYFHNLIERVKTGTDILALILNEKFDLGMKDKECNLEKNLRGLRDKDNNMEILIQKNRDEWLNSFIKFRDLIIHRNAVKFMIGRLSEQEVAIWLEYGLVLSDNRERTIIDSFLKKINVYDNQSYRTELKEISNMIWKKFVIMAEGIFKLINEAKE